MQILNNVIDDTDNEIGRLQLGRDISRPRKRKNILKQDPRELVKEELMTGVFTPWYFLNANTCALHLLPQTTAWIFMPCRHATCSVMSKLISKSLKISGQSLSKTVSSYRQHAKSEISTTQEFELMHGPHFRLYPSIVFW